MPIKNSSFNAESIAEGMNGTIEYIARGSMSSCCSLFPGGGGSSISFKVDPSMSILLSLPLSQRFVLLPVILSFDCIKLLILVLFGVNTCEHLDLVDLYLLKGNVDTKHEFCVCDMRHDDDDGAYLLGVVDLPK